MLVKEIMSEAVKTAKPESLIRDVAMVMCFNKISGMPVVDDEGKIVGMISEKDILWGMFPDLQDFMGNPELADFEAFERDYKDIVNLKVANLMTTRVYTVEPDMPVLKAAAMMFRHRLRRLPVARDGKVLGIISVGDVHKAIFQKNITNRT